MKKLVLILALAALSSGCTHQQDTTYHITCWSGGKAVYESEVSDLWTTRDLIRFRDENGERVILRSMECVIETNRPRYEP